ncbi:hypothetical protein GQ44DRAFT_258453 [Phaeosphaeriaceae sp. PMI808]|nr:hypothetical protein GQ44DRAFT_258453 [Phaeosphaeriaceae sp. PMI808]
MVLANRDPNRPGSGRTSLASDMSAISRMTNKHPGEAGGGPPKQDLLTSAGPGVMSMLRTSTEMAISDGHNVGPASRMSQQPSAPSRRSTASSLSSHSQPQNRHRRQNPSSSSSAQPSREPVHNMSRGLYPRDRDRDSQRSSSLTHSMQQHAPRMFSNNRSTVSLQSHTHAPRSTSPFAQLGRPRDQVHLVNSGYWLDPPASEIRHLQTYRNLEQAHRPGQATLRVTSDTNLGRYREKIHAPRDVRGQRRGPSPGSYQRMMFADPVPLNSPPSIYYPAVAQARNLSRSVQGSSSSRSTNMRTDIDTPSSDMPLPPTPRDGMPMSRAICLSDKQLGRDALARAVNDTISSSPPYYDYSEQFESNEFSGWEKEPVVTGLMHHSKKIPLGRTLVRPPSNLRAASTTTNLAEVERFKVPALAELPASPVPRPITRVMIRKGLEPVSTIGDLVSSTSSPTAGGNITNNCSNLDQTITSPLNEDVSSSSALLSQAASSVIDSSTLEFAVKYSIPAMTRGTASNILVIGPESMPASPSSLEKNTEDGISDLLAGYEHTGSKQDEDVVSNIGMKLQINPTVEIGKTSCTQRFSDKLSSNSCMGVPHPVLGNPSPDEEVNTEQLAANPLLECRLSIKAENPLFPIRKNSKSWGCTSSMPTSRLPSSSNSANFEQSKTASSIFCSSPIQKRLGRVHGVTSESSLSMVAGKLRASSRPSVKQGSISLSGSSSTLSVTKQPPAVPPRDSSASQEAQRVNAVGAYLMRRVVPARFTKSRHVDPKQKLSVKNSIKNTTNQPVKQRDLATPESLLQQYAYLSKKPSQILVKSNVVPEMNSSLPLVEHSSPTNTVQVSIAMIPSAPPEICGCPTIDLPLETISVYPPQDNSLKVGEHSSSVIVSLPAEHNGRDSRTTTHLSWGVRHSFSNPLHGLKEPCLPISIIQEDTTTDLRLSAFRYNAPRCFQLQNLKESDEISSLDTRTSDLKISRFCSVDGRHHVSSTPLDKSTAIETDATATKSHTFETMHGIPLIAARGLPTLEFCKDDLLEQCRDAFGNIAHDSRPLERKCGNEVSLLYFNSIKCVDLVKNLLGDITEEEPVNPTGMIDRAEARCAYSPKNLIEEIDQVTIPSVAPLTERFTEMLPSLSLDDHSKQKKLRETIEFPEEDKIMEHVIEEIQEVHPPVEKRSSRRLRPVPGSSALIVVEDDVFEEITGQRRGSVYSGEQCDGALENDVSEAGPRARKKNKNTTHASTVRLSPLIRLSTPPTKAMHTCSYTLSDGALRTSVESTISSGSVRSFASTPTATTTRPWNYDKNYPWNTTKNPYADISLPPRGPVMQSSRTGPSHLRNTLSDATTSTFTSACTVPALPIDIDLDSNRQSTRLNVFGRGGDQVHAVGERYPTTALNIPTAIFRDNLATCDTSDDEEFTASRKNKVALKKRFSSVARHNKHILPTSRITRSRVNPVELAPPASDYECSSSTLQGTAGDVQVYPSNRQTFRGAEGMRTSTYHRQRIVDTIKRWWYKGGDWFRSISHCENN